MGSNTSKATNESTAVVNLKSDLDVSGNPDPRSPTPEIIRTPLQNKPGSKHNITKNVDLRKTFESNKVEEKLIHNNPILSAVIKNHLQSYDPRSPTQDFERTPVITASIIDELASDKQILRLQSDNCASPALRPDNEDSCDSCAEASEKSPDLVVSRNLCAGFLDMTLSETLNETEEPQGCSTASNEALENTSRVVENEPTKLLETNFEYVECDNEIFENSEESIDGSDKTDDNVKCIPVFKLLGDDPRSPSIGIERTPIVVAKTDDDASERNVEEMSDDTLIKVLQSTNTELRQNVTKGVQNNEGLLIYEDEATSLEDTPKKSKSASNNGLRTPLSCMKNKADVGHTRSKSANTLYDPNSQKNASKIPKRVSHIPRLKCLSKQPKFIQNGSSVSLKNISKTGVGGDCENTPPHSHRDRWDKDSSIVL